MVKFAWGKATVRNLLKKIDRFSFVIGFICAGLLFFSALTLSAGYLATQGVTVYLDSDEVARVVREQIIVQAELDLPRLIAGAKAEIPEIVEKEMQGQLTSDKMEIAGFVFRRPDELMEQLKSNIQLNVENAAGQILDGIDTQIMAEQFDDDVYHMVKETMHDELDGRSFQIIVFGSIPIRIWTQMLH